MKNKTLLQFCTLMLFMVFLIPTGSQAQQRQSDGNLLDELKDFFKQDYLSIGVLLQSQGEFHYEPQQSGQNTFRIPNARLKVYGELDNNFSYVFQGDVSNSPALLDANISYAVSDAFSMTTGAMKPGISAEFLTPASGTDFINRSRIVSALVQSRDIGFSATAKLTEGLTVTGGIFNGQNQNLENNDNEFYYTGRVAAGSEIGRDARLEIGGNIAYGEEGGTFIGNRTLPDINGVRAVYGGDIRLEIRRFLLSGEFLGSQLEYITGVEDQVLGFHLTGGYQATDELQFLVRLDHIESTELAASQFQEPLDLVIGGINYNITDAASFQLNYQLNPDDIDIRNQVLMAQMQIAF